MCVRYSVFRPYWFVPVDQLRCCFSGSGVGVYVDIYILAYCFPIWSQTELSVTISQSVGSLTLRAKLPVSGHWYRPFKANNTIPPGYASFCMQNFSHVFECCNQKCSEPLITSWDVCSWCHCSWIAGERNASCCPPALDSSRPFSFVSIFGHRLHHRTSAPRERAILLPEVWPVINFCNTGFSVACGRF